MKKTSLTELRNQIDLTDHQLIEILRKRMSLVELVGKAKSRNATAPLDPARWQVVMRSRTHWGSELGIDPTFIADIFNRIHEYSLQIEGNICKK